MRKISKNLVAFIATGTIALTGATGVHANNNNIVNEILSATDGYENVQDFDELSFYGYETNQVEEPVAVEEVTAIETSVEPALEEPQSNLLDLLNNEANMAVLDYFDEARLELDGYLNSGDEDSLVISAQQRIAISLDFLFFGGSINNYKKEQVNEETLQQVIDLLNNYIDTVEKISPAFLTNMEPKYDKATIYLENEFIKDFDEIGLEIVNGIENEEVVAQVEAPVVNDVSEEASLAVDAFYDNYERLIVDEYYTNGRNDEFIMGVQDIVKISVDFLFYNETIEGYNKNQVNRSVIKEIIYRINDYVSRAKEISPAFLTNMDPVYNECLIYFNNESIDRFDEIGAEILANPVDEADETYTLR